MSSEANRKKNPSLVSSPSDLQPEANPPERVRKPHYDWEHETGAEDEHPRLRAGAARLSQWKKNLEAWVRRYLLLTDCSLGDRDDDATPA